MRIALLGICVVVFSIPACDQDDFTEPLPAVVQSMSGRDGASLVVFRTVADNGVAGNGYRWNGYRWNGYRWDGFRWNGLRWNSVQVDDSPAYDFRYEAADGRFHAEDGEGTPVIVGPTSEVLAEGDHEEEGVLVLTEMRISEIEQVTGGSHDFQFQRVQSRILPDGEWEDGCLDGQGNPTKAILLRGDWSDPDYSRITDPAAEQATTWACRGAALAKCVEWGYHPDGSVAGTSLADHHQACTRMVRADYCGDGNHHTENGTPIDVEDSLGIQLHETSWPIEAAWGPDGALCLNDPRKTYWTRDTIACGSALPSCDANGNGDLGDDVAHWLAPGARFVTRNVPTDLTTAEPAPADGG